MPPTLSLRTMDYSACPPKKRPLALFNHIVNSNEETEPEENLQPQDLSMKSTRVHSNTPGANNFLSSLANTTTSTTTSTTSTYTPSSSTSARHPPPTPSPPRTSPSSMTPPVQRDCHLPTSLCMTRETTNIISYPPPSTKTIMSTINNNVIIHSSNNNNNNNSFSASSKHSIASLVSGCKPSAPPPVSSGSISPIRTLTGSSDVTGGGIKPSVFAKPGGNSGSNVGVGASGGGGGSDGSSGSGGSGCVSGYLNSPGLRLISEVAERCSSPVLQAQGHSGGLYAPPTPKDPLRAVLRESLREGEGTEGGGGGPPPREEGPSKGWPLQYHPYLPFGVSMYGITRGLYSAPLSSTRPSSTPPRTPTGSATRNHDATSSSIFTSNSSPLLMTHRVQHRGGSVSPPGSATSSSDSSPEGTSKVEGSNAPRPRYSCPDCGKHYSTLPGLAKHRQFHCLKDAQRSFGCKHCDKVYTSLGALKMHIRTHTLPCKCHLCGKAFSRPWLLQGHIRTHTGEKPFQCSQCDRSFADRSNLRAHLQTHSDVKKYACRTCPKTFSRMSLLVKHEDHGCPGITGGLSGPSRPLALGPVPPSPL
ncbi:uncharacterized protein LOC143020587 [Oratosquilla oratoria]|uniref:uncharacterized protein LOC143020587 n=1 Tax=Oratosquilla oratoria TaxID=337810 RepID=UPI003F76A7BD